MKHLVISLFCSMALLLGSPAVMSFDTGYENFKVETLLTPVQTELIMVHVTDDPDADLEMIDCNDVNLGMTDCLRWREADRRKSGLPMVAVMPVSLPFEVGWQVQYK